MNKTRIPSPDLHNLRIIGKCPVCGGKKVVNVQEKKMGDVVFHPAIQSSCKECKIFIRMVRLKAAIILFFALYMVIVVVYITALVHERTPHVMLPWAVFLILSVITILFVIFVKPYMYFMQGVYLILLEQPWFHKYLDRQMKRIHKKDIKPIICPNCGTRFNVKWFRLRTVCPVCELNIKRVIPPYLKDLEKDL
jgi:hypothetical protein